MEKLVGNDLQHESWAEYAEHSVMHDNQTDKVQELEVSGEVPSTPLPLQ
jgi:hypothetical protein